MKCPYCAEEIQEEAIICKHCKSSLVINPSKNILNIITSKSKQSLTIIAVTVIIAILFVTNPTKEEFSNWIITISGHNPSTTNASSSDIGWDAISNVMELTMLDKLIIRHNYFLFSTYTVNSSIGAADNLKFIGIGSKFLPCQRYFIPISFRSDSSIYSGSREDALISSNKANISCINTGLELIIFEQNLDATKLNGIFPSANISSSESYLGNPGIKGIDLLAKFPNGGCFCPVDNKDYYIKQGKVDPSVNGHASHSRD